LRSAPWVNGVLRDVSDHVALKEVRTGHGVRTGFAIAYGHMPDIIGNEPNGGQLVFPPDTRVAPDPG